MTFLDALKYAQQRFNTISDSARLDAECLLCFAVEQSSVYLRTWPEKELQASQQEIFFSLVQRREQGEPIAYIVGEKQFWSLDLNVTKDTLIPRPETELLVEQVLKICKQQAVQSILELGTGSGAIAIAIASELTAAMPATKITAIDISQSALEVAQKNAQRHQQDIEFRQSDWFNSIAAQHFDVIVTNPPYIERGDIHLSQGDLRFEPECALVSGDDGLDAIEKIIQQAKHWLKPQGWLLFEHGYNQAEAVRGLFQENSYQKIKTLKDLAHNERISFALNN